MSTLPEVINPDATRKITGILIDGEIIPLFKNGRKKNNGANLKKRRSGVLKTHEYFRTSLKCPSNPTLN